MSEILEDYRKLNKDRNDKLLKIYTAFSTYEEEKQADWMTNLKVNKAHEVVERVVPRIIAKNPRWIVSPKLNDFYPEQELPQYDPNMPETMEAYNAALEKKKEKTVSMSRAVQDYLEYVFDEYNYEDYIRAYAKAGIVNGKGWAKVGYRYETERQQIERETETGFEKSIEEVVTGEYPIIEVKSWTEIYSDPRFRRVEDMPAFFEISYQVRLSDLKRKKNYFNLDKVQAACSVPYTDTDDYKKKVQAAANISNLEITNEIDKNALTLVTAWAYWEDDEDTDDESEGMNERFYEFCFIEELQLLVSMREVTKCPYIDFNVFEDTETNFAVGFVEPILGLQDELNFQKNAAISFINQALNRTFVWSPNSNIDPRDIISKPYGIIPTTGDVPTAMLNLQELPMRSLPSDYFNFQNDIERQIQGQTFTVDTSNQKGQQALTDTATGARIEFFESNVVLDQVRKNFEQALQKIAYMILKEAFENIEENVVLKKLGAEEFWELNKEALRDAVRRYSIKVETGSSTYDDIANRRQDAMAWWNILKQANDAGVPINMKKTLEDIGATFEKKDMSQYFQNNVDMGAIAGKMPRIPKSDMPELPQTPAEMTQQVAGGQMLSV